MAAISSPGVTPFPLKRLKPFFGWLAALTALDMLASSKQTRRTLGWEPAGSGLIANLETLYVSEGQEPRS